MKDSPQVTALEHSSFHRKDQDQMECRTVRRCARQTRAPSPRRGANDGTLGRGREQRVWSAFTAFVNDIGVGPALEQNRRHSKVLNGRERWQA